MKYKQCLHCKSLARGRVPFLLPWYSQYTVWRGLNTKVKQGTSSTWQLKFRREVKYKTFKFKSEFNSKTKYSGTVKRRKLDRYNSANNNFLFIRKKQFCSKIVLPGTTILMMWNRCQTADALWSGLQANGVAYVQKVKLITLSPTSLLDYRL